MLFSYPEVSLYVGAFLMSVGLAMVLTKRNIVMMLIGVELMLNASNLNLVAFGNLHGDIDSHLFTLFVIVIAVAETSVALALLIQFYKAFQSSNLDE